MKLKVSSYLRRFSRSSLRPPRSQRRHGTAAAAAKAATSPVAARARSGLLRRSPAPRPRSGGQIVTGVSSPRAAGTGRIRGTGSGSSWATRSCAQRGIGRPGGRGPRVERADARGRRPCRKPGGPGLDRAASQAGGLANISGTATRPLSRRPARGAGSSSAPSRTTTAGGEGGRVHAPAALRRTRIVRHRRAEQLQHRSRRRWSALGAAASRPARVRERGTVTDFSSIVARIPNDTQVVYTPWQLAAKAQLLGQQLRASGKGTPRSSAGTASTARTTSRSRVVRDRVPGGSESSGRQGLPERSRRRRRVVRPPSYVAVDVAGAAVQRACADRQATRAEVRRFVNRTNIPASAVAARIPVRFQKNGKSHGGFGGTGDNGGLQLRYVVYRINDSGQYVRVG